MFFFAAVLLRNGEENWIKANTFVFIYIDFLIAAVNQATTATNSNIRKRNGKFIANNLFKYFTTNQLQERPTNYVRCLLGSTCLY